MGFKISPQDAFERAERQHDKFNKHNKTVNNKLPTLAEQIEAFDRLEEENRKKRMEKRTEESAPRFSPLYDAKFKSENNKKK
jgi:hypothetical protein